VSEDPSGTSRAPVVRASDAEREAAVARLQTAVGEGRLDLDEFGERVQAAHAATTTAELAQLLADLPPEGTTIQVTGQPGAVEMVGERDAAGPVNSVFGDVQLVPAAVVPERVTTVFGDVRLDLRQLKSSADTLYLELGTVFGDVEVLVAEGVAAESEGWTVFGDRKTQLAAVPRLPGTPRIVVRAWTVFGDLKLRSLAAGEDPRRWRAALDRFAARRLPPPPA
jgi:Domain of unknown function (DUF1707)